MKKKETDTAELLKECDSGVQVGICSIEDTLQYVRSASLRKRLEQSKAEHERLRDEIQSYLADSTAKDEIPGTNSMAKAMSWLKTNATLVFNGSEQAAAKLITEGCDMGINTLTRYLNEYQGTDEKARGFATRLIRLEDALREDLRAYL